MSTPDYWVRQVREAVRFADGVACMEGRGVTRFVELGPDGVLCGLAGQSASDALFAPVMRRDRDEAETALHALARLWTVGVDVDWPVILPGGQRVALPTYAFQRDRYWPRPAARTGDVGSVGQAPADHALLGATVQLAGDDGLLLTGRLSLLTHPWLADHAIRGQALVPGTAFVDMALRAGAEIDRPVLEELVLQAPLPLPDSGVGVQVQVRVAAPGDGGECRVEIHARQENGDAAPWACHAVGTLTASAGSPDFDLVNWPPSGSTPVALDGFYEALTDGGYGYGPVFQGLRKAWRAGETVYAEVELPDDAAADAAGFGVHPALLDAALHVSGLVDAHSGTTRLPFAWTGVRLHAVGASALRVAMTPVGDGVTIRAADEIGAPVASVGSLVLREVSAEAVQAVADAGSDALFAVDWLALPVVEGLVDSS
ncbi:polyketide synthase dehydratase domain-containing protein, partial [Streptomyces ossamyceticus]|nr:polyketide synthase dehydratase domain-containing protein [Streptomyces ossamyceticus]